MIYRFLIICTDRAYKKAKETLVIGEFAQGFNYLRRRNLIKNKKQRWIFHLCFCFEQIKRRQARLWQSRCGSVTLGFWQPSKAVIHCPRAASLHRRVIHYRSLRSPFAKNNTAFRRLCFLVETRGLEPMTSRMWTVRSDQLSYASMSAISILSQQIF